MNSVDSDKAASPATASDTAEPIAKLAYATPETAPLVPGRREFFRYRDLGVTDATGGRMRAQLTIATGDMQQTGWHYHLCESQFIFTLRGWVDLLIEDGRKIRVSAGESLLIPGGLKHNEIAVSKDFELLEVSVPAKMGTVACDPPEAFASQR